MTDNIEEAEFEQAAADEEYEPTSISQYALICYLTSTPQVWTLAMPMLHPGYFDNEFADVVEFCMDFSRQYNRLPSKLAIRGKTGAILETPEDVGENGVQDWLCGEVESFCRRKRLTQFIIRGSESVGKDDSAATANALYAEVKDIANMSLRRSLGVEVHDNIKSSILTVQENSGLSCGLKHLDLVLDGGFSRQSLNLITISSGGGKSVLLANIAYNYARLHKFNVIYISLELNQDKIRKRFASIMTDTPIGDVYVRANDITQELELRLRRGVEGSIFVKKLPMNGTTTGHIRAYIHDLHLQTGLTFDVVAIDYMDLVEPSKQGIRPDDIHLRDKYVAEELHGIMDDYDFIGFSASQRTKGSEDAGDDESQGHVAGGVGKVNTIDNLIFGRRTDKDRAEGRMTLTVKKSRDSGGHGKRFPVCFNNNTLVISDAPEEEFQNAQPFIANKNAKSQRRRPVNSDSPAQAKALESFVRRKRAGLDKE